MKNNLLGGIAQRFAFAFALVVLTWNPSNHNYYVWARNNWDSLTPVVLFVGLMLLVGWIVFVRATARSLGPAGLVLSAAIAGSILWMIIYYGLIDAANRTTLAWVVLTLVAAVLTMGMSWSHLRRRWSGQLDVDDVEDEG